MTKHAIQKALQRAVCGGLLAGCLFATPARAQINVEVEFPPADFIATTTPVYFEGRAAYWYNGRWYYRDGRGWGFYRDEPVFLRDWRGHHEPERRYYEGRRDQGRRDWHRR